MNYSADRKMKKSVEGLKMSPMNRVEPDAIDYLEAIATGEPKENFFKRSVKPGSVKPRAKATAFKEDEEIVMLTWEVHSLRKALKAQDGLIQEYEKSIPLKKSIGAGNEPLIGYVINPTKVYSEEREDYPTET